MAAPPPVNKDKAINQYSTNAEIGKNNNWNNTKSRHIKPSTKMGFQINGKIIAITNGTGIASYQFLER